MSNPRNIALNILLKIEQDNAYSNIALNNAIKENKLSGLDSSFVSALVYGVLERKITLDYIIKQYSKIPLRKIELKTKMILSLSISLIFFMLNYLIGFQISCEFLVDKISKKDFDFSTSSPNIILDAINCFGLFSQMPLIKSYHFQIHFIEDKFFLSFGLDGVFSCQY